MARSPAPKTSKGTPATGEGILAPSEAPARETGAREGVRRQYVRDSEENRREALIAATRALVAEGGPQSATVRAIAQRAGVTPGLIRHYYGSKDELVRAAYRALVDGMTEKGIDALGGVSAEPGERLAAFVAAALRPPVVDMNAVALWAGYVHRLQAEPALNAQHEASYLQFRNMLQQLIEDLGRPVPQAQLRQEAVACNAVLDGLWLEGSLVPHEFQTHELVQIGLRAIGAILRFDLTQFDTFVAELRHGKEGHWE